jgi:hypothetical protein
MGFKVLKTCSLYKIHNVNTFVEARFEDDLV